MRTVCIFLAALLATPALAGETDEAAPGTLIDPLEVVGATPLDAEGRRIDRAPAAAAVLGADDLARGGPASLLRGLDSSLGGIALNQAQANPFQPSLLYRGFEASPLAGNAQGLAVYVGGVRFNQPFGDTVDWDLIPDVAVSRVELAGSNPAFGLNALGGAISVRLKDGFGVPGGQVEAAGGAFGRRQGSAELTARSGAFGVYGAASVISDDGWRDHSPSRLRQAYLDIGWKDGPAELHLSAIGADNDLTGNGPAPAELLAFRRRSVFTYPDETHHRFGRLALSGSFDTGDGWTLQGSAYLGRLRQRTANGDAAEVEPCDAAPALLCLEDEDEPLTDVNDAVVPNFVTGSPYAATFPRFAEGGPYALLNQSATQTTSYGAAVQVSRDGQAWGRPHRLLAGVSFDGGQTHFRVGSRLGALDADRGFVGPGVELDLEGGEIGPVAVRATRSDLGLFISDSLELTDAVTLTASGRLNRAQVKLRDRIGTELDGDHTFTRFNPATGLAWRLGDGLSAYAGYARTSRAPTPAEFSCADPEAPCSLTNFFVSDPPLRDVVADTFEAGLRGSRDLAGIALAWRAGAYRTDVRNDIQMVASEITGRGYFVNVGRTRREGVEAGLSVTGAQFSAYVDYAYTRATYRSPFSLFAGANPAFDDEGEAMAVETGDRRPGVPGHNLKAGVEVTPWRALTVGLSGQATSGRVFAGDEANLDAKTRGYAVLDAYGELRVSERLELFAQVTNLTNRRYATFGTYAPLEEAPILETPPLEDPRSLSPGAPRAVYAGVRITF